MRNTSLLQFKTFDLDFKYNCMIKMIYELKYNNNKYMFILFSLKCKINIRFNMVDLIYYNYWNT